MRIAILSTPPVTSHGWGRYTRDLIVALAAQGHEIVFIASSDVMADPSLPIFKYHRFLASVTAAKRFNSLRLLAARPAVGRAIADCDVVHVIAEPYVLAVPPGPKLVVTAHGTYLPRTAHQGVVGALYRRIYHRATAICVSRYTEQQVLAAVPAMRTVVIPNGVDFQRFQQPGQPQIKTGPTILSVGQVKARKGFHILAQAMKEVRQAIPDAQAVFIGDSSDNTYPQAIEAQLATDALSDADRLFGRVSTTELHVCFPFEVFIAFPA